MSRARAARDTYAAIPGRSIRGGVAAFRFIVEAHIVDLVVSAVGPEADLAVTAGPEPVFSAPLEPWRDAIFRTRWWLDAVAPGAWGEVVAMEGGEPRAQLAFSKRRMPVGALALGLPPITPWLGPWIHPNARDPHGLVQSLIRQLPRAQYITQHLDPRLTDWLPFQQEGFSCTSRYTYVIDDLSDVDRTWAGMRDNTRGHIR